MTQAIESAGGRGRPPLEPGKRKSRRYPTRWTSEHWEQVRKAAKLLGIAPAEFITKAAVRSAKRVLRREGKG